MKNRRWLLGLSISLLIGAIADQVCQYTVLSDGTLFGRRLAPFDPPLFNSQQKSNRDRFESSLRTGIPRQAGFRFDDLLGWCPPRDDVWAGMQFDWAGGRVGDQPLSNPRREDLSRVVAMGCSMTLGYEVEDREGWVARLDQGDPSTEFANLAVPAYGVDQALLRFRRDGAVLEPDEVWLGWLPAASLRLGGLYRPAQRHWCPSAMFKPRFRIASDGELTEIPPPATSVTEALRLLTDQEAFLAKTGEDDMWVARAPLAYGAAGSHVLHYTALGRLLLTAHEWSGRDHVGLLTDHESEIHRLLIEVVDTLARESEAIGARFRLVVLPDRSDLAAGRVDERPYWHAVTDELTSRGIEVLDCVPGMLAGGALERDDCWAPGGHYSAAGNQLVADTLSALLER